MEGNKYYSCGADLKELGVLCETSVLAQWNEKDEIFTLDMSRLNEANMKDFELKCPSCYDTSIDALVRGDR